ncbi:MAG TPA: glycosyltransferase family 2 protein, partial [Candidatus Saccharimonadales bacterium]|nr:glycosyltransferase family 2 protein [Candidatus Saccharimonadales bacterium]
IPAYNEEKSIVKTLESLKNQTYQGKVEIIVVDNNSTDNTAQIAEKLGAKVIFESQKGVAHARQAGFMAAKGDLIVTTDSDTILPLNWLSWYDNQFQKNPKAVMISGMYNFYDGSLILNFANWALNYFLFVIFSWYSGANMAVKRNAFKTVNGFDTTLPLSEDSDLGVRLRKYGKVLRFANFKVQTSARRFNSLGFFGGLWDYSYNYTIFKLHIKRSNVNFRSGSEVKELGRLPRLAIQLAVIAVVLFSLFGVMEVKPVKAAVVRNQHRIKNQMQKVDVDMIDVNWQQVKSFNHVSH